MDLENLTPLPAAALKSAQSDEMLALLLACATYDLAEGQLELSPEQQPLRLAPDPAYANDAQFIREGVSLCVEGFVYAPGGEAKTATAELSVGEHQQSIKALGPRVWWKGVMGKLKATEPRPFQRVEMSWELAYGGMVHLPNMAMEHEGEQILVPDHDEGWVMNMIGTGFYLDEAMAVDSPLPQLEDPEQLISSWDDRPEPVCFAPYPLSGGLRAASLIEDGIVQCERSPRALGRGCPRTTFTEVPAGTVITVSGMRPDGEELSFAVPEPPILFDVHVGSVDKRLSPQLDAIDINAEEGTVRFAFRRPFRYPVIQLEKRRVRVEPAAGFAQSAPAPSTAQIRDPDAS